ncbi:MAG: hypothetical protein JKX72_03465 [Robiginitomaculum sp.]|nr:hypothetical protein [Robiginitomaculum sp.]
MTKQQYQDLVSTYGVHPARWPEDLRLSALTFTQANQDLAAKINEGEAVLDSLLDAASLPETVNDLLMARIITAAKNTPQQEFLHIETPANDHPTRFLADDEPPTPITNWKKMAATLLITMGIGFVLGQSLTANSEYYMADTLLAFNSEAESSANLWSESNQ